jgi:alpha-L-fucosidase
MTISHFTSSAVVRLVLLLAGMALACAAPAAAQETGPNEDPNVPRMRWFRQARFGMFIHWGVYSVPAGEWKDKTNHAEWIMLTGNIPSAEYEKFAGQFNPVKFDAKEWVRIAKDAGMKYMVITSKHHDGFCMFDTKLTDYSIVKATPFKRDPMKELAAACKEAGIVFCFYYSDVDWHHPEFPAKYCQRGFHGAPNPNADLEKYVAYMKGQVRELLTNYGPLGILWFDGGGSFKGEPMAKLLHSQEIIDMIRQLQPACLVNNRLGLPADYGTPEQRIPDQKSATPFEVCMTLNRHWGYNKNDTNWKEAPEVIHNLCDIASKGGNYLLNVGPTAEGLIPPDSVRILKDVGKWMAVNGQAIYGTTASPWKKHPFDGRCTVKGGTLYVQVFKWPSDGSLKIAGLKGEIVGAEALDKGVGEVKHEVKTEDGRQVLLLTAPEKPDPIATVVAVRFKDQPAVTE